MIGWLVAWKCLVACLFFESSQQPTCPHSRQRRKCTQVSPIFKQSSHPLALGVTSRIWSRCVHRFAISISFTYSTYKAILYLAHERARPWQHIFPSIPRASLFSLLQRAEREQLEDSLPRICVKEMHLLILDM